MEAWYVTLFMKPAANTSENRVFNYWVSHVCVILSDLTHKITSLRFEFNLNMLLVLSKAIFNHYKACASKLKTLWTCIIIHTIVYKIEMEDFNKKWDKKLILNGLLLDKLSSLNKDCVAT